jgi:hypothetical protein
MTKRTRSDSEGSIPELEHISAPDSDEDEVLRDSVSKGRISKLKDSAWVESDDSDVDDQIPPVEHSLLEEGGSQRIEPFSGESVEEEVAGSEEPWLDSSEGFQYDVDKARKQAEIREAFWSSTERGSTGPERPPEYYLNALIESMNPGETPRSALDRLLGTRSSQRPVAHKSTIKARRNVKEEPSTASSNNQRDIISFNKVTEYCDSLVARGLHSVLEESREKLIQRLKIIQFEYRWKGKPGDEIYGPFAFRQLIDWNNQGCFREYPIEVRYAKSNAAWREFNAFI